MRVAYDNKQCLCSTDGHIESLGIGEEAKVMADIRINHTDRGTDLIVFYMPFEKYDIGIYNALFLM